MYLFTFKLLTLATPDHGQGTAWERIQAKDIKAAVHMVAQDVLRCWEAALQKARGLAIDANGNQVTIAGVPVPCAGNWRQP